MSKSLSELITSARNLLPIEIFPEREEEIIRIIHDVFSIKRHEILYHAQQTYSEIKNNKFISIVEQRSQGTPLAYILGYTYFWNDKFPVSPQTLIPRHDTEHLLLVAQKLFVNNPPKYILDIGTGTGILAISLHRIFPQAEILAIDIVSEPFLNSINNLELHNQNISFHQMNFLNQSLWNSFPQQQFDLIISNPPYLDDHDMHILDHHVKNFEPHSALYAGSDGMIFYKTISTFCETYLNQNGQCILEIDHKYRNVIELFSKNIFTNHTITKDYNNLERVFSITKR